jgi:predicted kinase
VLESALEGELPSPEILTETAAFRAACMWLAYGAGALWDRVMQRKTDYSDTGTAVTRLSPERWTAWERRLRLVRDACANNEKRQMIDQALAEMGRVQQDIGLPTTKQS